MFKNGFSNGRNSWMQQQHLVLVQKQEGHDPDADKGGIT